MPLEVFHQPGIARLQLLELQGVEDSRFCKRELFGHGVNRSSVVAKQDRGTAASKCRFAERA